MAVPLVISMGDPAGIGPEIIAKAWAARHEQALPPFVVAGDPVVMAGAGGMPIASVARPAEGVAAFDRALPVLPAGEAGPVVPGVPSRDGAAAALAALEAAIAATRGGDARALVTGPVSKAELYRVGFTHPGQTEYVAAACGIAAGNAVMLLAGPGLRVVPITVHVPLASVPAALSIDLIVAKARVTAAGLRRDFAIPSPRLAFAGVNPHAGESGALGREEIDLLEPAIASLRAEGIDATGPFAADTMFHGRARAGYDVAMCCYHDQALVPLKTLFFDDGVNMTLGLPIVRTSPDHGTAFGIAGRDAAHPGAMIAAIRMAAAAADCRARGGPTS